jgi:hypothetical protein
MRFVSTPSDSSDPIHPAELQSCLAGFPFDIAVRSGSAGTPDEHALSDLDIGIVLDATSDADRTSVLDRIRAALLETTGRDAIDLVDLETAGPHLGYEALSTGELLSGTPPTPLNWRPRTSSGSWTSTPSKPGGSARSIGGSRRERLADRSDFQ